MDSLGDVWVSDGGNNRIQEFDTYGNYLSEFAVGGSFCIAIDSTTCGLCLGPTCWTLIVVPEPSALALLAVSAIGLMELRMATATTGIGAANAKTMRGGPGKTPLSGVVRLTAGVDKYHYRRDNDGLHPPISRHHPRKKRSTNENRES